MNAAVAESITPKHQRLASLLREMKRVVVAFSAGVDSTLVLKVALDTWGRENVLAATGVSPSLARRELESVKELARLMDAPLELVGTDEVNDPNYAANPSNRCYYCKTELYTQLSRLAETRGFGAVVNGVNADDLGDGGPACRRPKSGASVHRSSRPKSVRPKSVS